MICRNLLDNEQSKAQLIQDIKHLKLTDPAQCRACSKLISYYSEVKSQP